MFCADVMDVHGSGPTDSTFRKSPNGAPRMPHFTPRSGRESVTSGQVFHLVKDYSQEQVVAQLAATKYVNYELLTLLELL